jgi:hypothetical protein
VVFVLRVLRVAAAIEVSVNVTASSPKPLVPAEVIAVSTSDADPVMVLTVAALTVPVVAASRVLSEVALIEVSLNVTASSPRPLKPVVLKAVLAAAAVPVMVVTVAASTVPVVFVLRVLRVAAAIEVSANVTASSPKPLIPAVVNAVFTSDADPVRVVTVAALTVPVVFPLRVFRTDADNEVSLIVTASVPSPLIVPAVPAVYAALTSAAVPVRVVEVTDTATEVLPSSAVSEAASTDESVTAIVRALPDSVIPERVSISLSLMVAVKVPEERAAMVLTCETVLVPLKVIASFPNPVNPVAV